MLLLPCHKLKLVLPSFILELLIQTELLLLIMVHDGTLSDTCYMETSNVQHLMELFDNRNQILSIKSFFLYLCDW